MSILQSLNNAEEELKRAGIETARLDAEVLLAHTLGVGRIDLFLRSKEDLSEENKENFRSHIDRRLTRTPVAYITGTKEFWSIPIKVTPDVLIPRPETELIVEEVLKLVGNKNDRLEVLDLCTGSGCVPAALAHELPNAMFTVTDISDRALDVARENLSFARERTRFFMGDLFEALRAPGRLGTRAPEQSSLAPEPLGSWAPEQAHRRTGAQAQAFDIITANPPYIPTGDKEALAPEITRYEPHAALFGGKSGLDLIEKIIKNAPSHLKPGGYLLIEMGIGQSEQIREMASKLGCYKNINVLKDLAGVERVVEMMHEARGKKQEARSMRQEA